MDITLSKAQQDMSKEARRFLKKECPKEFIEQMFEDPKGYTDDLWSKLTELDWPAMIVPEKYDGMGMDLIDLVMVLEETGRSLLPGPFFSTVVLAAQTIMAAGNDAQKQAWLPKSPKAKSREPWLSTKPTAVRILNIYRWKPRQTAMGLC
jgi:alkylation response protein AidB-like acyl-CoA dehydrogenase